MLVNILILILSITAIVVLMGLTLVVFISLVTGNTDNFLIKFLDNNVDDNKKADC